MPTRARGGGGFRFPLFKYRSVTLPRRTRLGQVPLLDQEAQGLLLQRARGRAEVNCGVLKKLDQSLVFDYVLNYGYDLEAIEVEYVLLGRPPNVLQPRGWQRHGQRTVQHHT